MNEQKLNDFRPNLTRYASLVARTPHGSGDLVDIALSRAARSSSDDLPGADLRTLAFQSMQDVLVERVKDKTLITHGANLKNERVLDAPVFDRNVGSRLVQVRDALNRIPFELRATLLLVVPEGLSYAEVAKVTGVSVDTVRTRLLKARLALLRRVPMNFSGKTRRRAVDPERLNAFEHTSGVETRPQSRLTFETPRKDEIN